MTISYEESLVGENLTDLANEFGACEIKWLGESRYLAIKADGGELRMLSDEGVGSIEGEEGFDEAWANDEA